MIKPAKDTCTVHCLINNNSFQDEYILAEVNGPAVTLAVAETLFAGNEVRQKPIV